MSVGIDPNKAKTARRVIEVLEFFDEQNRQATVMDIARRYGRPQSSTSELLAILVEMGLLYKDARSRAFMPTPRAAMLGAQFQPAAVRDGRLSMLVEQLRAETGLGVAVLGMVGRDVQVFRWLGDTASAGLSGGAQSPLHASAAGWLLLSTLAPERREGVLRRLRAEAPEHQRFSPAALSQEAEACGRQGHAVGPAGFGGTSRMAAVLLPAGPGEQAMVLALVHEAEGAVDPIALTEQLRRAALECAGAQEEQVVRLDDYRTWRGEEAGGSLGEARAAVGD
jgi:DNA-binding IclR family transcriptional regulator